MLYQPVQRGQLQLWHRERRKDRTLRGGEKPLLVFFQQRQRPEGCHHRVRQRFESSLRNDHRCLQFPRETVELSRNITVIPARKRVGNTAAVGQRPKLKVAAYCRVSTDSEEQASSYEVQVAHYTQFIRRIRNGNWPGFMLMCKIAF